MTAPPETSGTRETEEGPVRCACGRLLTDPASRARGLGPHCYRRLRGRTAPRPHTSRTPTRTATTPHQLTIDDCEPDWSDGDYLVLLHDLTPHEHWDLRHQGITAWQLHTMQTINLTGSYL